jgi:hypothetical protein
MFYNLHDNFDTCEILIYLFIFGWAIECIGTH